MEKEAALKIAKAEAAAALAQEVAAEALLATAPGPAADGATDRAQRGGGAPSPGNSLELRLVSERFRLITPLQNCLFTPELQWQSRGE